MIVSYDERILVTGANGFLGSRVVEALLRRGFNAVRCFVRPSGDMTALTRVIESFPRASVEVMRGNLLSRDQCRDAVQGAAVILHVAAGIEKTFAGCFIGSVVTTRNLLEAASLETSLKRFVNVSSLTVYANAKCGRRDEIDESGALETEFMQRYDAYCYGKTKQDELVIEYGNSRQLPYVIVRPGPLYGPGARSPIHSRVGTGTFGVFLHIGGANRLPLSYVDNCADAVVVAGVTEGIVGHVFNVVDDRSADQSRVPPTVQEERQAIQVRVRSLPSVLSVLLRLGTVRAMVAQSAASGLQHPEMCRGMEGERGVQPQIEGAHRLDAAGVHRRGAGAPLRVLQRASCLERRSSGAAGRQTRTLYRSARFRIARSSPSATATS